MNFQSILQGWEVMSRTAGNNRTKPATALHLMLLVHLVQNMGINTQEFLDSYQLITYLSKIGQNFEFHNVSDVQRFMDYIYRLIHEKI